MGDGEGVTPSAMLTEFVSSPSSADELVVETVAPDEETNRMIPQLTSLITTTVGKVAIGGGVIAAAVTGIALVEPEPVDDVLITAGDDSSTTAGFTTTTTVDSTAPSTTETTIDETPEQLTTLTTTSLMLTLTTGIASTPPDTVEVPGVGVVTYTIVEFEPTLLAIEALDGWTVIDESTPGEIDLSFRAADGRRVDVDIEREDGEIRVRVEDESETADESDNDVDVDVSDDDGDEEDELDEDELEDDDDGDEDGDEDERDEDADESDG